MIPPDLADLIKRDHNLAYDAAVVTQLRRLVNGNPWDVITRVALINKQVNQNRLFNLIMQGKQLIGLTATCAADVMPEAISWLWPDRIALGKLTLIAGDPGLGKSMLTAAFAAHVTNAAPWPVDRSPCPLGAVIMASAEDDIADTIRPRLDAAGADPERVFILNMISGTDVDTGEQFKRTFNIEKDIILLEQLVIQHPDCKLITIDPISAYLGKVDSHNNAEIRATLAPLSDMAAKHHVAIIGITHFNKSGPSAMYRAMGSLAFVAAARAAYAVTKDQNDPDRRLFLPLKNNLGDDKSGFAYTILTAENGAPYVAWEIDQVTISADEALSPVNDSEAPALRDAEEWLLHELRLGSVKTKELQKLARDAGISWRTVERAKTSLGVKARSPQFSKGWEWYLPFNGEALEPEVRQDPDQVRLTQNLGGEGGHGGGDES
ncbi:MAG: AAA family ATPase [Chromatiaceae bacterium]|nr:AAA family ATPase [Chromatiaceae bacterium]